MIDKDLLKIIKGTNETDLGYLAKMREVYQKIINLFSESVDEAKDSNLLRFGRYIYDASVLLKAVHAQLEVIAEEIEKALAEAQDGEV